MLNDLIIFRTPPENRRAKAEGGIERHFTEAAIMLAFGFHLFDSNPTINRVEIHPDGEHAKQFPIRRWLENQGFILERSEGKTDCAGEYSDGNRRLHISFIPGLGDVVAEVNGTPIIAECKGAIINTRHPGQKSRLRKGLCEAVGQLMSRPEREERQFAVVPHTDDIVRLASKLRERCAKAGIHIYLVKDDGSICEDNVRASQLL